MKLWDEIHRYLAAVDAFRDEGCEPRWRAELHATALLPERSSHCLRMSACSDPPPIRRERRT